jgi:hypothetical protein
MIHTQHPESRTSQTRTWKTAAHALLLSVISLEKNWTTFSCEFSRSLSLLLKREMCFRLENEKRCTPIWCSIFCGAKVSRLDGSENMCVLSENVATDAEFPPALGMPTGPSRNPRVHSSKKSTTAGYLAAAIGGLFSEARPSRSFGAIGAGGRGTGAPKQKKTTPAHRCGR